MDQLVPDELDEPTNCTAMAKQAGVSATTLRNWTKLDTLPLATVGESDAALVTWRGLLEFCRNHPERSGTKQVTARYRAVSSGSGSAPGVRADAVLDDTEGSTLRRALGELKAAVEVAASVAEAAETLARQAEKSHRDVLAASERLARHL